MNIHVLNKLIKTIMLLFIIANCFILTGCWDRREVFDMAVVLGTAIDKTDENEVEVTVQILVPKGVGSQAGIQLGGGKVVVVRSDKGKNIADATSNLEMKLPRNIFWGHCKMFIFGESLVKENGIRKELDFILRHPQPRERAYVYIAEDNAKKFLEKQPYIELYVGEGMRKMIEKKIVVKKSVKDVQELLTSDAKSVVLPYMKQIKSGEKGKENLIATYDAAVFKKDKMVGLLNNNEMRGVLLIRNESKINSITVPLKGQNYVSARVVNVGTKLDPIIKKSEWKMNINVTITCAVSQNGTNLDMMNPKIVKQAEKEIGKVTKSRIEDALQAVQKDLQVDVLGFADSFHQKYPKEWRKVEKNWDEFLPEIKVKTKVSTNVLRSGLTTLPTGLERDEVEK
ncbi:Ger(x)C family spore germination protein [Niallia sp. 01092]|uniref:Ger(x)C family spore germination protein n=1 Tax=unclassified Niallia TaxID=2837522 RepID=UPI003FD2BD9E